MSKFLSLLAIPFLALPAVAAPINAQASWYGPGFHGRTTANGERYNQWGLTAAHKSLPFGTRLRVCNVWNKRCVNVRINDRGPFIPGRSLDLSRGAADAIGMVSAGVVPVTYSFID
tara:strand:- start:585 stop:932 length:348 start_codon:yes stop_codon:yes gene_type:complete